MDTDTSSDENSSSECTTDSSDDDRLETAQIGDVRLQIPQGLCERQEIFQSVFSAQTWNSLSEGSRQHLRQFLPDFPQNDDREKANSLQKLFNGEDFRFGTNPLLQFHEHLKAGHYSPDIAKMRQMIGKAEQMEAKQRYRSFKERLKKNVLESRRRLLNVIRNLPPGVEPRLERSSVTEPVDDSLAYRTKRRYFQELAAIKAKVDETGYSSDENYPEGPPVPPSRKQKRHLNTIRNSVVMSGEKAYVSSLATKSTGIDLEKFITPTQNPFVLNEDTYKLLLLQHKRRKLENLKEEEIDTKTFSLSDIIQRTQLPYIKKLSPLPIKHQVNVKLKRKLKKEPSPVKRSSNTEDSDSDASSNSVRNRVKLKITKGRVNVKSEPVVVKTEVTEVKVEPPPYPQFQKITPATFSDLDGIDMMNLPIDLEDSNIDILELNNKPELMQETHANYLSLIRDIICSTNEHRMNMKTLEERLRSWQENPISPLNDWYSLSDNWVALLQSAINFLSGCFPEQPDDFVPYIEYKPQFEVYQWIGAGRDSDAHLSPLARYWMDHRDEVKPSLVKQEEVEVEVVDRSQSPPPPRCPTTWTVRKADADEIKSFREQERKRYDNPHKAFTYRCNGYESVVGPLKGIYNASVGNTKARGHTMLNADRPNFVTILSLVRDATARLPNGEGTRADICELLKSSQYISKDAPDNVLQSVVSGALDRMHTQFDPCVKYDPKRKIWIYLHRNRTEEDFERLHQQYQGMNKTFKKATSKTRTPTKQKPKSEKIAKVNNKVTETIPEKVKSPKPKPIASLPQMTTPAPVASPGTSRQATSVLLPNNIENVEVVQPESKQNANKHFKQTVLSQEEKEINEALQAIVQSRGSSPITKHVTNPKTGKSLVKIISPNQGKSLIIPSTGTQLLKQQEQKGSSTKSQVIAQQLLQTLNAQQKLLPKTSEAEAKLSSKVPATVQQQILQNIKNVTLLRSVPQSQSTSPNIVAQVTLAVTETGNSMVTEQETMNAVEAIAPVNNMHEREIVVSSGSQMKAQTATSLTPAQQQQILQTLKEKVLPLQSTVLTSQQQPVILKQKAHTQKQMSGGTSLLGQPRLTTEVVTSKATLPSAQTPVVAKVLTNAAGQVISVGSLLAQHQKQQGGTLRVPGGKTGQPNIIQLTPKHGSQNNFITLASQPKLAASQSVAATTSVVAASKPTSRTAAKAQTKLPQKVAQQLMGAKLAAGQDGPKIIVGQNQKGPKVKGGGGNMVRMVNAGNLNLTHIGGKPVLLAGKAGSTIQTIHGQNVILQAQPNAGGSGIMIQNTAKTVNDSNLLSQPAQMVLAPQIKVQQTHPQVVLKSAQNASQGHIVLGGNPVRLQSNPSGNPQRVVLASSSQGGQIVAQQILFPAGFQGAAINIKALQGVKVIPVAQAQHSKGVQGRQVFARLMGPTNIVRTSQPTSTAENVTETPTTSE